jgi:hypothetical protein
MVDALLPVLAELGIVMLGSLALVFAIYGVETIVKRRRGRG